MNNNPKLERVKELDKITIPRLNKETRDLIQDLIFEGSIQSDLYFDDFMKLVDMHKRKRLDNTRFYELLNELIENIKSHLNKNLKL